MDILLCFCSKFWFCAHILLPPFLWQFLVVLLELKPSVIPRGLGEINFWGFLFPLKESLHVGFTFCLEAVSVHKRTSLYCSAATEQNLPEYRHVFTASLKTGFLERGLSFLDTYWMALLADSEPVGICCLCWLAEIHTLTGLLMHVSTAIYNTVLLSLCGQKMKGLPQGTDKWALANCVWLKDAASQRHLLLSGVSRQEGELMP